MKILSRVKITERIEILNEKFVGYPIDQKKEKTLFLQGFILRND